jgi:hypothetical protein
VKTIVDQIKKINEKIRDHTLSDAILIKCGFGDPDARSKGQFSD